MKLFYRETGSGQPLIILHGLYGASDNWTGFARLVAGSFRVFLADLRNHGQSPHTKDFSLKLMADDVLTLISDLGIEKPILAGHSLGGKVAMMVALQNPQLLKRLIVMDVSPRAYRSDEGFTAGKLSHRQIVDALIRLPLNEMTSREEADKWLAEFIGSERVRQFLLKNLKREDDGRYSWKLNITAISQNLELLFEGFTIDQYPPLQTETLFVKGGRSSYLPQSDYRLIQQLFPVSRVEVIGHAGHWVHADAPEELVGLIEEFGAGD